MAQPGVDARPGWALAAADQGQTDQSQPVDARVYLAGRDEAGLTRFVNQVSDPASPGFGRYLSPAGFADRFGPTATQVADVTSWLRGAGLAVTGGDRHYLAVRGSVAQAERAFGVSFHNYRHAGKLYRAPAAPLAIPAAVRPAVLAVTGLDDAPHVAKPTSDSPPISPVRMLADPCSKYTGEKLATTEPPAFGRTQPWTNCGYTPQQMRSMYGLDRLPQTGAGVTVAIMDAYASSTITSDVTEYSRHYGIADFAPGQFVQNLPSKPFSGIDHCGDWNREETLDVDIVHDLAPAAKIQYVSAASCSDEDLRDALSRIVDGHLADLISNSWTNGLESAEPAPDRTAYEAVFKQAAAEGIGVYFATGDCGYLNNACDGNGGTQGASFPASDPFVTAVGGTTTALGPTGRPLWQTSWGTNFSSLTADHQGWTPAPGTGYPASFDAGSGGGVSTLYGQPAYQQATVPAALARALPNGQTAATPMRVVPDVSADGDNHTGLLIGQTQRFVDGTAKYFENRMGGTSLACPLFVAIQALAQQAGGGHPLGFANPQLYARHATPAFDDITDTPFGPNYHFAAVVNNYTNPQDPTSPTRVTLSSFGSDGPLHAVSGYDDATGIGAPSPGYVRSYQK
ncbi:S53 family peptidase [Fodinicola acaciae]|uniref:S53 family peptidase n=1 Tax=Fodinicola acaciae TaxID=2681555 RepID=UPI001C9E4D51|nr:S53 family peptidase [Fodinicola acaciae]